MNPGQGHFVPAIAVGEVFTVSRLSGQLAEKLRDGNILLVLQQRRIGKRPQVLLRALLRQPSLQHSVEGLQRGYRLPGRPQRRCIDLGLVFTEIPHNVGVARKWMLRMRHSAGRCDTQALLFQAKVSMQHPSAHIRNLYRKHSHPSLPCSYFLRNVRNEAGALWHSKKKRAPARMLSSRKQHLSFGSRRMAKQDTS